MPKEFSAGAVIYTTIRNKRHYLLLRYPPSPRTDKSYWDLPKGHIEEGEEETDTIKREVKEETGLKNLRFIEGFREEIVYFFRSEGKTVRKKVIFYLAQSQHRHVKTSHEHIGYVWIPYEEGLIHLKWVNAKTLLKKANNLLSKKSGRGGKKNTQRRNKNVSGHS